MTFQPGDVILFRGRSWLSKSIRFLTRSIGESRTKVNHVGIITKGHTWIDYVQVTEALSTVKSHRLFQEYAMREGGTDIAVFRPINLTLEEKQKVCETARSYEGRTYGYLKILTHLLDWCLLGAYCFRRVTRSDRYPICSWLVAHSFASVGKDFGVAAGAASPDDIYDFCVNNPDKYEEIRPLTKYEIN